MSARNFTEYSCDGPGCHASVTSVHAKYVAPEGWMTAQGLVYVGPGVGSAGMDTSYNQMFCPTCAVAVRGAMGIAEPPRVPERARAQRKNKDSGKDPFEA